MAHLGVRRQRFDMTASIPYNFLPTMRAYSRPDTELRELLRKGVGANVSRDDLGRAYDKAQQNRSADMLKLRALIKDYEAMGMDFTEIVNAFSRGGAFPDKELGETMRGVLESSKLNNFIPLPFKEEQTAESMYGINVPYDLFQDIYNHYEGRTYRITLCQNVDITVDTINK